MLRHHDVNTMWVDCSSGIPLTQHRSRNGKFSTKEASWIALQFRTVTCTDSHDSDGFHPLWFISQLSSRCCPMCCLNGSLFTQLLMLAFLGTYARPDHTTSWHQHPALPTVEICQNTQSPPIQPYHNHRREIISKSVGFNIFCLVHYALESIGPYYYKLI